MTSGGRRKSLGGRHDKPAATISFEKSATSVRCHSRSRRALRAHPEQSGLRTLSASILLATCRSDHPIFPFLPGSVRPAQRNRGLLAQWPNPEGNRTADRTLQDYPSWQAPQETVRSRWDLKRRQQRHVASAARHLRSRVTPRSRPD